jgi:hypothetical protein
MIFFGFLSLGFAFESDFKSYEGLYQGILAGVVFPGMAAGYGIILWSFRKRKLEIENGYTPRIDIAQQHPELFLIAYKTLEVISRPNEPRPTSRRT